MNDALEWLTGEGDFPARWHCGDWSAAHGWTHIVSDLAITGAYIGLALILARVWGRFGGDRLAWWFAGFIASCGLTHLAEAVIFWLPVYRVSAGLKVLTAVVSLGAFVAVLRRVGSMKWTP